MITLHVFGCPVQVRPSAVSAITEIEGGSRLIVDSRMMFVTETPDEVMALIKD